MYYYPIVEEVDECRYYYCDSYYTESGANAQGL